MKLHLIRHGTTTTSGQVFAGRSDVPLNDEGRRMAQRLAEGLSSEPITQIAASPLARAIETARPLAKALGLDIRTDPRLLEFDFGAYEGRSKRELGLKLRKSHATQRVPGGEALIDVWERAGDFVDALADWQGRGSGNVAVVGHFWINRMIFGHIAGRGFDGACRSHEYRPQTGSRITLDLAVSGTPRVRPRRTPAS